jgi:hypothetical protein
VVLLFEQQQLQRCRLVKLKLEGPKFKKQRKISIQNMEKKQELSLPLGPKVRETASASLSIPACKASLQSLPKDIFFGPALTTNLFTT